MQSVFVFAFFIYTLTAEHCIFSRKHLLPVKKTKQLEIEDIHTSVVSKSNAKGNTTCFWKMSFKFHVSVEQYSFYNKPFWILCFFTRNHWVSNRSNIRSLSYWRKERVGSPTSANIYRLSVYGVTIIEWSNMISWLKFEERETNKGDKWNNGNHKL